MISGTATLSDLRKAASQFDLVVLDSFGKLDVDALEFENLRTDFPQTVFVIIFQKTATGSIRGGASIIFNSAATIDITKDGHERIATMVKGRYGTQGWRYSIATKHILQQED